MPGGGVSLVSTTDVNRIEAPVTARAYFLCAFAAFGGIFFGYDSGYINGVTGSAVFINSVDPNNGGALSGPHQSLITSILSAGTFFGALIAGDLADHFGRRPTIIAGCFVYILGVIIQICHTHGLALIVTGRLIAGFGVGFVTAIIVLYMSEIAPKKVRGTIVSGYQFCITIGLLLASCITYGTERKNNDSSYRIPIGIQFIWGVVVATGLFYLPESPRFFVKKGKIEQARNVLSRLRGQPRESEYVETELAEIVANAEYERQVIPDTGFIGSWAQCFTGSLWRGSSNIRLVILGTSMQMMQQWTGVNFIFYYSTSFLQSTGAIGNPFVISIIFTLINVCSTPISFYTIERFGRRSILLWGALGMLICEFLVAVIGVTVGFNKLNADGKASNISAVNAQIAFICIYIFFFASTWGPAAWVLIGEIFPLPIRSRGVALSTASNWLWNTVITVITPYMVNKDKGYLRSSVFFIWGGLCTACLVYTYFLVPETKGLSLEQVDLMMQETTPRTSAKWRPHETFASKVGLADGKLQKESLAEQRTEHVNEKQPVAA